MCTTSGRHSLSIPGRSLPYLPTGNRSASCRAISGSRSQTQRIPQSRILPICAACASAIFPHPTIATLSMLRLFPGAALSGTAPEVTLEPLFHGYNRRPAQPGLQLLVTVIGFLPHGMPFSAIEDRRQLPFGPPRIPLPAAAQRVTHNVRKIERREAPYLFLVETEKTAAGR